jgi:O-methyltransferase
MLDLSMLQTQRMPLVQALKAITPPLLWQFAYRTFVVRDIAGASSYRPQYAPWFDHEFEDVYRDVRPHTLVAPDRCWYLSAFARQALTLEGSFLEAGTYKGGTALLLRREIERAGTARKFYILDSFEGMLKTDAVRDRHKVGDLSDTSLEAVQQVVGVAPFIDFRKGWIPATFAGLEGERFAFAHVDVDLYRSILDCCEFLYPRLQPGGFMVFDDYGFPNNPGARRAVDEFFADKREVPIVLASGQAVICKLPHFEVSADS